LPFLVQGGADYQLEIVAFGGQFPKMTVNIKQAPLIRHLIHLL
jgi:hypothetical protein